MVEDAQDADFEQITEEEGKAEEQEEGKKEENLMDEAERKELLDFLKQEEDEYEEEVKLKAKLEIPSSILDLTPAMFPLFLPVKKLIFMLDASLQYPFFTRDNQGNIIGMDKNLGWHSENKGVMMINKYFKDGVNVDEQISKFGMKMMDLDKEAAEMDQGDDGAEGGE